MRLRKPFIRFAAFVLVAGTLVAVPAGAGVGPVLWSGQVRDTGGAPSAAEVIAYLRPAPDQLEPGDVLTPIARTTTDTFGRFTLRTPPTDSMLAVADPWITVMVVAYAAGGMSLAVDSVAWRSGRWITRPGELDLGGIDLPGFPAEERPPVLVIQPPAARTAVPVAKPPPAGLCAMDKKKDLDPQYVRIGDLHLFTRWGGRFNYSDTKSTSFEVGWRPSGKNWSVAGTTSGSHSTGAEQGGDLPPEDSPNTWTYEVQTLFKLYTWRCKGHDQEHTDSWGDVETVEATGWAGGVKRYGGGPEPGCNRKFESAVPGGQHFTRTKGASSTYGGAISILGFSGSVTSAASNSVTWSWHNSIGIERNICGESNWAKDHNTRVRSME